jgi:hypothetical protein
MRYGMREEITTVRDDTTEAEMQVRLVDRFRAKREGNWHVSVEDGERNAQEFRIEQGWRYTFETRASPAPESRRPVVEVTLRKGRQEHTIDVPDGTTEAGMKRLLISGFGAHARKR